MTAQVWVQLSVGVLTVIVAYFAARSGARATSLQERAARREEWWRRTQWAIDQALHPQDRRQALGVRILDRLVDSELAQEHDRELAVAALEEVQRSVPNSVTAGDTDIEIGSEPSEQRREGNVE